MKGTKVQTLGAVAGAWPVAWVRGHMRTANLWAGPSNAVRDLHVHVAHASYLSLASWVIVSGFRAALDLDTYALRLERQTCAYRCFVCCFLNHA